MHHRQPQMPIFANILWVTPVTHKIFTFGQHPRVKCSVLMITQSGYALHAILQTRIAQQRPDHLAIDEARMTVTGDSGA